MLRRLSELQTAGRAVSSLESSCLKVYFMGRRGSYHSLVGLNIKSINQSIIQNGQNYIEYTDFSLSYLLVSSDDHDQ